MIEAVFSLAFVAQIIRIAVPYVLAGLGGTITERSGVIDLALEAKLLFGAFAAAAVAYATDSTFAGILAGVGAGMAVSTLQIVLVLATLLHLSRFAEWPEWLNLALLSAVTFTTLASGIDYVVRWSVKTWRETHPQRSDPQ